MVYATETSKCNINGFLSALKHFYAIMKSLGIYNYSNPLIRNVPIKTESRIEVALVDNYPTMPEHSGVSPSKGLRKRLSDNYFLLIDKVWAPKIIDDLCFPKYIFQGGQKIGWNLREEIITRMLFETGARISEICGLDLSDWLNRGVREEAITFNKGSHGRRVKFLRWSRTTTKLVRRYFDYERIRHDINRYRLSSYLQYKPDMLKSLKVPLFLNIRGIAVTPTAYRQLFWNHACKAVGINAHIHQARHWYVTMAIRQIHETSKSAQEIARRTKELIKYMGWRSGEHTLKAYEHYFDQQRHAQIQNLLHLKLDKYLKNTSQKNIKNNVIKSNPIAEVSGDVALDYLYQLGGDP